MGNRPAAIGADRSELAPAMLPGQSLAYAALLTALLRRLPEGQRDDVLDEAGAALSIAFAELWAARGEPGPAERAALEAGLGTIAKIGKQARKG